MTTRTAVWLVHRMLDGLAFRARHWQLLAQAEQEMELIEEAPYRLRTARPETC